MVNLFKTSEVPITLTVHHLISGSRDFSSAEMAGDNIPPTMIFLEQGSLPSVCHAVSVPFECFERDCGVC